MFVFQTKHFRCVFQPQYEANDKHIDFSKFIVVANVLCIRDSDSIVLLK